MPKLQRIKRSNGSLVYSINIPLEFIEELGWDKGDELEADIEEESDVIGDPDIKLLRFSKKNE